MSHTLPRYVNEPGRLILRDGLAELVIISSYEFENGAKPNLACYEDVEQADLDAFQQDYEVLVPEHGINGAFLADTDFYRGINAMAVVRRRVDGKHFGFAYWNPVTKHDGPDADPNGDEHGCTDEVDTDAPGFDWDTDFPATYVFMPVEAYVITGYRHVGGTK